MVRSAGDPPDRCRDLSRDADVSVVVLDVLEQRPELSERVQDRARRPRVERLVVPRRLGLLGLHGVLRRQQPQVLDELIISKLAGRHASIASTGFDVPPGDLC